MFTEPEFQAIQLRFDLLFSSSSSLAMAEISLLFSRSVCPPYNDMDFDRLVKSLEDSEVISSTSLVVIEYPKEVSSSLKPTLGGLTRLVNRTYGRTTVAMYGPSDL